MMRTLRRRHNRKWFADITHCRFRMSTSAVTSHPPHDKESSHLELRELLDRLCIKHGMMGCSCSVMMNGEYAFNYGFGYADINNPKSQLTPSAVPHTLFRVASLTKPMTATAISLLINDPSNNEITYNSTIYDVIKDHPKTLENFQSFRTLNQYMDEITIHDLLCHQSGLRHYVTENDYFYENYKNNVLNMFGNDDLVSPPGQSYHYTVYGYQILGMLIECLSGMPYFEFIKQKILDPAQLKHTFPAGISNKELPAECQRAKSYIRTFHSDNRGYKKYISCVYSDKYSSPYFDFIVGSKFASGGYISTATDMAKFGYKCVIENAWKMNPQQMFFGHSVVDEMASKYYGYGWFMEDRIASDTYYHFGGPLGGYAYLKVIKHMNLSMCIVANLQSSDIESLSPYIEEYFSNHSWREY